MKPLPPDPPIYVPPPERWFDQHRHSGDSLPAVTKTLMAMWLMVHDRLGLPLPTKNKSFGAADREGLDRAIKTFGDDLMFEFSNRCNRIERDGIDAETAFRKIMFGG